MSSTLEDIEFLSRSPHRVNVLQAVAKAPRTRHELKERADVSRVTIRRLLEDLEDREWIDHQNDQYEATAKGRVVAHEFARLESNLSVADRIDEALEWLPTDEFDFNLAALHDADVVLASSWENQTEIIRYAADLVQETDRISGTAIGFSHEFVNEIRDHVVSGAGEFEVVIDEGCLRMIRHDTGHRERFSDMLASGNATLHRYTGNAPLHMVVTFGDPVQICGHIDEGPPPGSLESTHPEVLDWAQSYFEWALTESDPIGIEALSPEPHGAG